MKIVKLFSVCTIFLALTIFSSSVAEARWGRYSRSRSYSRPRFSDPMMNPRVNPMVNPKVNPMANPKINPMANPKINPWVNPLVNPAGPRLNPPPWRRRGHR